MSRYSVRTYRRWQPHEILLLEEYYNSSKSIEEIAVLLNRPTWSIHAKMQRTWGARAQPLHETDISIKDLMGELGINRTLMGHYIEKGKLKSYIRAKTRFVTIPHLKEWMRSGYAFTMLDNKDRLSSRMRTMAEEIAKDGMPWLISRKEICDSFGVTTQTVHWWCTRLGFPKGKIFAKNRQYFLRDEVKDWCIRNGKEVPFETL